MRINRRADSAFSFKIRSLLAIVACSAIGLSLNMVGLLFAIGATAIHYSILSLIAERLAAGTLASPYCRWRFFALDASDAIRTCTATFLILFAVWHLSWIQVLLPPGLAQLWHARIQGSITLSQLEHCVVAAFTLLLISSFLTNIYGGTSFSRRNCIETSTLLTFLLATHLAIP